MKGFSSNDVPLDVLISQQQTLAKEHGRELTEEEAFEEVIANALEGVMTDGKVAQFLQQLEGRDKSLGARVRRFFHDIAQMIRDTLDAYAGVQPDSVESMMISQLEDTYKQLQKALAEGIYQAGENFRQAEKNSTGEGGVRYKTGGKRYWYPNMTGAEIADVRAIARNEANKTDNYLGIAAKWLYNKEKGHEYFALYSTMDAKEPTVLYACKNERAKLHNSFLLNELQREENISERFNTNAGLVNGLLNSLENVISRKSEYSGSVVGTGSDNGNASVHSRNKRIRLDKAFINCLRNIEKVQQQYGLDDHYRFTKDAFSATYDDGNPDIRFSVRQKQNPTVADMLKKEVEKRKGDVEKMKIYAKI